MKVKTVGVVIVGLALLLFSGGAAPAADKALYNVLVVMSYSETHPWCREIKAGIDSILSASHQVGYFYMHTKSDFAKGPQKAKEAFELFKVLRPDGVIAADDDAQSMFVVPYLKDKVKTPVMFCGVNADSEKYGYPATNVSGILERPHIAETIAFARQLVPSSKTVGFMAKDSPTIWALRKQVLDEYSDYSAKFVEFKMPTTREETLSMVRDLKGRCDLLFIETLQGVTDTDGRPMKEQEIIPLVADTFEKPVVSCEYFAVRYGALCAVVKTGKDQGVAAARMLLKAMQGTPVDRIPIEATTYGKRYINVTVMKKLGINPKPVVLQGAQLVRTEE